MPPPAGELSRSTTQGIDAPRRSEAPRKVVGFHVEGATPSPIDSESLINKALKSGSLSPVIIPPSFQQGQRSPEDSPRQLSSAHSSRRASEDTPRSGSRVYSPQRSKRSSLDEQFKLQSQQQGRSGGGGQPNVPNTFSDATGVLALTPIDPDVLSAPGPDEHDLTSASERAIELLRAEEARQMGKTDDVLISGGVGVVNGETRTKMAVKLEGGKRFEIPEKKKMTKAERRALQEAQRAAKAEKQQNTSNAKVGGNNQQKKHQDGINGEQKKASGDGPVAQQPKPINESRVDRKWSREGIAVASPSALAFFDHLPKREQFSVEDIAAIAAEKSIPVQCLVLGMKMQDGSLRGTNNRSLALLRMVDEVVASFELSEGQSFTREFTVAVKNMVSFLVRCRPLSPAVGNVVKSIKAELGHLASQSSLSNEEARAELRRFVATFAQDKISAAQQVLAGMAADKINDGDIILTFSRSSTVERTLKQAAAGGKKFSVVVADSSPLYEGKALLNELLEAGIPCEYMLFNSLETGMNLANKVMVGAAAVMSNGAVLSRAGTAACAMSASLAHVPVIVCSETYKFHERVQLDSIMNNELADPSNIAVGAFGSPSDPSGSNCLNIVYDLTPSDLINVVITEVGALPPTSVPVVLREFRSQSELYIQATN